MPIRGSPSSGPQYKDFEIKGALPKKVVLNDLPKFKGTEDPEDHLRSFTITMALKGMGKGLFSSIFPLTLDTYPSKWFKSLNKAKIDDWEYIKEEFLKQYCYNAQLPVGLRELETTKQGEKEDFATFLTRWREKAAQMTNRPTCRHLILSQLVPGADDYSYMSTDLFCGKL
ncbi:DNA replication licensing factor mcm6 [Bienertia sinuspersici]